jgi:integrase
LALRPEDVDWLRRRLYVGGSINVKTRRREETKSSRSRWVTLPSRVVDVLSVHVAEYPSPSWVFPRTSDGGPWKATKVVEAWRHACDRLGVSYRFHDLRHGAASLMIHAGWSVKRVQAELGHADPMTTLRTYAKLWPDELDHGRQRLDEVIAESLGPLTDRNTAHTSPKTL